MRKMGSSSGWENDLRLGVWLSCSAGDILYYARPDSCSLLWTALISGAVKLKGILAGGLDEFSSKADSLSFPGVVLVFDTTIAEPEQPLQGAFNQFIDCPEDLGLVCFPYTFWVARVRKEYVQTRKKVFFMSWDL